MTPSDSTRRRAFLALLAGAVGIAYAPIAVRLSEVGPTATAFHRLVLALPFLWIWLRRQGALGESRPARGIRPFAAAGILFAADLALWHGSIQLTTVANSTLFANFAPFVVTIGAWWLFKERITRGFVAGMITAIAGAALLAGASIHLNWKYLVGDLLGILAAMFYGCYLLSVKSLRQDHSTARIMFQTGLWCAPALLITAVACGEAVIPATGRGWLIVFSLAIVSQVLGQSLIAYAFAHLPAGFSSLSLLLQPVVAALLAWVLLDEPVGMQRALGGMIVLGGIWLAKKGQE